jgi:aminoglycoside phosphotransferase (APT) family kinase protein
MSDAVTKAFCVTPAELLGDGWESTIYALGAAQVLRIPRPEGANEDQLRAQAALTSGLPPLPFAVPRIREIARIDGQLYVIEDRIPGRAMAAMLPELSGDRRAAALRAYLEAAETMSVATAPGQPFGDLLLAQPRRCDRWADYLTARVRKAAEDEVLAAAIPGLAAIVERFNARLEAIPDPVRCIVHGDIWPPNVMMNEDLQVTGLIDFSFTTRVGDHVMDLAGACHFLLATKSSSPADHDYLKQLILAKHGAEVIDRIGLYAVWFAFDFAFNHDDTAVFAWCANLIRDYAAEGSSPAVGLTA